MTSLILLIGSGVAALVLPSFVYIVIRKAGHSKKKRTVKQANKAAASLLAAFLFGIPLLWAASVAVVGGFSYLPPQGHLLLWGTIGVLGLLIGAFALIRNFILKAGN